MLDSGTEGDSVGRLREEVEAIYRSQSRQVLATLIRLLGGDFDRAEDAMHEAFGVALDRWAREGIPANPAAWLVSTGRFKAIDRLRKARLETPLEEAADIAAPLEDEDSSTGIFADDRLRLIFACCHPALAFEARVALTLREVCGLTTEEIARAYLTSPSTMAQRIVRAKAKIKEARIPYEIPAQTELPERLDTVLHVIYLVFNEGYSATSGESLTRPDLSGEAIRLGRLLWELLPEPEVAGLLALMFLHESRRPARTTPDGDLILMTDQDRSLWNRDMIREGSALVMHALGSGRAGPYTLQAAISAAHAQAASAQATDWNQIVGLYDALARIDASPIIGLNRAVAVAMRDGPEAGLLLIDKILNQGDLADYPLAHSARADLYRRLGRRAEARAAYEKALSLTEQQTQRRFLEHRLSELDRF